MYNIDQLNDHLFEQTLAEVWDCPEVLLENEFPEDLWDD